MDKISKWLIQNHKTTWVTMGTTTWWIIMEIIWISITAIKIIWTITIRWTNKNFTIKITHKIIINKIIGIINKTWINTPKRNPLRWAKTQIAITFRINIFRIIKSEEISIPIKNKVKSRDHHKKIKIQIIYLWI